MALEFPRNSNSKFRIPPLLLGGLIVMCFFLLCNWWSLSSQNFELLKQIDNLAEQLRVNGEELGKCSQQQALLDEKLKDSQNKFVQQQIKIEQIKETENDVKEGYEKLLDELGETKKKCESLDSKFESCNSEKISLQKADSTQKQTIKTLQGEITKKNEIIKFLEEKLNVKGNPKKTTNVPSLVKIMQSKVTSNKSQGVKDEEKKEEVYDAKNYGDSSPPFPLENDDPREEEMNA